MSLFRRAFRPIRARNRLAAAQAFTMASMEQAEIRRRRPCPDPMTLNLFRTPAAFVFGTLLLASSTPAQTRPAAPASPYGGTAVEEIIARINDQIITRSDFDRAQRELDNEARQHGATMHETSEEIGRAHV